MNRFFSKLDLRDIKINSEGSHYPPDAEEETADVEQATQEDLNGHSSAEDQRLETETVEAAAPAEAPTEANSADGVTEVTQVTTEIATAAYVTADGDLLATDGEVLKVSARSRPSAVAGAIAGVVRETGHAEVQAIGAGATNQAIKAAAIAREYLRETGIDAVCIPAFIDVTIDNEDRTAIRLVIEPR